MQQQEMNPRLMKLFAWSGAVVVVTWVFALIALGQWIPPNSPAESTESVVRFYESHTTALRFGCCLMILTGCLWATWGAVIALFVRRMEGSWPILTYIMLALVGGGYVFFELVALFWVIPAFRPGEIDPDITRTFHDLGWFANVFTWPPFALFNIIIAIAIFGDRSAQRIYPRWVAYLNIWCALIFAPAGLIAFFKTGPFSYNGLVAIYIPLAVFFIWMAAMTFLTLQAINREQARQEAAPASAIEPPERSLAFSGSI